MLRIAVPQVAKDGCRVDHGAAVQLFGRSSQLSLLEQCLGEALDGAKGRLVLVGGEAGIGKTDAFARSAATRARMLHWRGSTHHPRLSDRRLGRTHPAPSALHSAQRQAGAKLLVDVAVSE